MFYLEAEKEEPSFSEPSQAIEMDINPIQNS